MRPGRRGVPRSPGRNGAGGLGPGASLWRGPPAPPPRRAWRAGKPEAGFPAALASAPPPAPGHRRPPRPSPAGPGRAEPPASPRGNGTPGGGRPAAGHRRTKGRGPPGARGEPRRSRALRPPPRDRRERPAEGPPPPLRSPRPLRARLRARLHGVGAATVRSRAPRSPPP